MSQDGIPSNVSHLSKYERGGPVRSAGPRPERDGREGFKPAAGTKFVAKGHDAQLQEAQQNRIPVVITTMGGDQFHGTVAKRDKFTITLTHSRGAAEGQDEIFYKHAIESVRLERGERKAA